MEVELGDCMRYIDKKKNNYLYILSCSTIRRAHLQGSSVECCGHFVAAKLQLRD